MRTYIFRYMLNTVYLTHNVSYDIKRINSSLIKISSFSLCNNTSFLTQQHSMGHCQYLWKFRRDHNNTSFILNIFIHKLIYFMLCSYINTTCRVRLIRAQKGLLAPIFLLLLSADYLHSDCLLPVLETLLLY